MDKKFKYKMLSEDDDEDKEMMDAKIIEQEEISELQKAKNEHYFSKEKTNMLGKEIAQKLVDEQLKGKEYSEQEVPVQQVPEQDPAIKALKMKKLGMKYGVK